MPPVYRAHMGFRGKEARLLDLLLHRWNNKVARRVAAAAAVRRAHRVAVKTVPRVSGVGIFNGPVRAMPPGTIIGYYCGLLVKDHKSRGAMRESAYDQNMRMTCKFFKKDTPRVVGAYINGDPAHMGRERAMEFGSRINHSCRPNCVARGSRVPVGWAGKSLALNLIRYETTAAIGPDQEFTIDYGREYVMARAAAPASAAVAPCLCGQCPSPRVMRRFSA